VRTFRTDGDKAAGLLETKPSEETTRALLGNGLDKALKRYFSKFIHF